MDVRAFAASRHRAGLSQNEASRKSGVAKDTISRIERGAMTPSLPLAMKLAEAYGVSLDALAGRDHASA